MNYKILLLLLLEVFFISHLAPAQNLESNAINQLDSLMIAAHNEGDYAAAIAFATDKLKLAEKENKHTRTYISSLSDLAYLKSVTGEFKEAELLFIQSIDLGKKVIGEIDSLHAGALGLFADMYSNTGRYEEAELMYLQAATIYKQVLGNNNPKYANTMGNLAGLYIAMGRYEEVEAYYLKALKINRNLYGIKHTSCASILNNLGAFYYSIQDYDKAIAYLQQSIEIEKEILGEGHPDYAYALHNLASVYNQIKEYESAVALFQQAAEIWRKTVGYEHIDFISTMTGLGNCYARQQKWDISIAYIMVGVACNTDNFEEIFPDFFSQDFKNTPIASIAEIANDKISKEDYKRLAKLNYKNSGEYFYSLDALSFLEKIKLNALKEAGEKAAIEEQWSVLFQLCKSILKSNERIRNDFSSDESKLRILKENHQFVNQGISAAYALKQKETYQDALGFIESNKAVLLVDALKGNQARVLGDLPDSLILKEQEFEQLKDDLAVYKSQALNQEEMEVLIAEENALNQSIKQFLRDIEQNYPNYHQFKYKNITVNAAEAGALLSKDELVLEYYVSKEHLYLIALEKDDIQLLQLEVTREELNEKVKQLRRGLSDYKLLLNKPEESYLTYIAAATWFYEKLVAPALNDKNHIKHLIVIPDGELGNIPFETFLMKAPTENASGDFKNLSYLIHQYSMSYSYSLTLLHEVLKMPARQNNGKLLAAAADYNKDAWNNTAKRSNRLQKTRRALAPLPEAKREIEALKAFVPGTFWVEKKSTETVFKKQAAEYSVLHLAMHGILNKTTPVLSALAFTEDGDSINDNMLHAYEISKLQLNADLVVLSACETGYGKFEQGEGVLSMARSFMYAGVPSLVVSLWQVNDATTAFIMHTFYKKLMEGLPKDEALRQAKLDYLKDAQGAASHPAFWSPFIQLGDHQSIVLGKQSKWWLWMLLAALVCLILGFVIWRKRG